MIYIKYIYKIGLIIAVVFTICILVYYSTTGIYGLDTETREEVNFWFRECDCNLNCAYGGIDVNIYNISDDVVIKSVKCQRQNIDGYRFTVWEIAYFVYPDDTVKLASGHCIERDDTLCQVWR